jgi:polar amino acid transport system substrate-binding protein
MRPARQSVVTRRIPWSHVLTGALGLLFLLTLFGGRDAQAGKSNTPTIAPLAQLAPTGSLRVALNLGNPILATKDSMTGESQGVSVDLGRALAGTLGVPFVPVEYPTVPRILEGLQNGEWDVAFLAIDPSRSDVVEFSPAYMEVDNTYLVASGSSIQTIADIDHAGVRVAVQRGNAADLFLSRSLQQAQLLRADTDAAAFALVRTGDADAVASNTQALVGFATQLPGSHVLDGRYTAIAHAMAVPKGDLAGLQYVEDFLGHAESSGLV